LDAIADAEPRPRGQPGPSVDGVRDLQHGPLAGHRRILDEEVLLEVAGAGADLPERQRKPELSAELQLLLARRKAHALHADAGLAPGVDAQVAKGEPTRPSSHHR